MGCAVLASCGAPSAVHGPAVERLIAIRIEGNHAIASESLAPALALHEAIVDGAAGDPYLVAADADRIRAAYIKRGFFAVTVSGDIVPGERGRIAVFTVVEGRRAVTRVEISGLPPELSPSAARARVVLEDGAPFDYDAYDAAKQALAELVQDAGYARARIDGRVTSDPGGAIAVARYVVIPGRLCWFGTIEVGAAHPDLEAAVRARLAFATGDRYSISALAKSQAEISQLGRFSSAQLVADRSGDRPVIAVKVELVEIRRHALYVGGGGGYDPAAWEVRGRVGGSWIPEAAPLVTAAADARVVLTIPHTGDQGEGQSALQPKIRIVGSLQRTDLWWPRLRAEIEGGYDYRTVEAYTSEGPHARLGLGSPLGPRWLQLRVGWLIERLSFPGNDGELASLAPCDAANREPACVAQKALGLDRARRLGSYEASLVADLRDDPIEPHRGGYLAISATRGSPFAGGEFDYWQVTPELRGYLSLAGVVVAVRARAGEIRGDVPVTERYYSGGSSSQRGFSERQLAPRVTLDASGCADASGTVVIGGAGLIETGIELRRPIATLGEVPIGVNLFLDGAEVTCNAASLDASPSQLHWAAGSGLWLRVFGVKIRGDVGYRLNHRDLLGTGTTAFDDGALAWHIGIGEPF